MKKIVLVFVYCLVFNIIKAQCPVVTGYTVTPPSCFGLADASVIITYSSGVAPFSIDIINTASSQSTITSSASQIFTGLAASATSYVIIITDNNGCQIGQQIAITEPTPISTMYNSQPATCGLSNGSVTLAIAGGTPTYSVVWNLPGTPSGPSQNNIPSGVFTATVTDANGCVSQQSVSIASPPVPSITGFTTTSAPSCFGLSNAVITLNYSTGTAPYTINWSSPIFPQTVVTTALSQSVSGIGSGVYSATVTDAYGCSSSQIVNVSQPSMVVLLASANLTVCYGQSSQIYASGMGGTPPYSYSWTPNTFFGGGPFTVNPTTTTNYTVSLQDANGCAPSPKVITVNVTPPLNVNSYSISICDGASTILAPVIASPGNGGPYTYNWSTTANTSSITVIGNAPSGTTTTTYTLVVDDGCTMPSAMTIFTVNASICSGLDELNNSSILFYPNPTNNIVTIESEGLLEGIEVTDITGKLFLSETLNTKTHTLNLQKVTEGVYFVKLKFKNGRSITKKMVKQ